MVVALVTWGDVDAIAERVAAQLAAGALGVPPLAMAELLPDLIDRLTPQGQLPADDGLGGLGALLGGGNGANNAGDLMGMLGGLMQSRR